MPSNTVKAHQYWVYHAHKDPDACALARRLNLDLPHGSPGGLESSLIYPIRRLVATGTDIPANMRLLFGVDDVPDMHAEARKQALMDAHQAAPPQQQQKQTPRAMAGLLDDGCPFWAPRPATSEERAEMARQTAFNDKFARILPYELGGLKSSWR